MKVQWAWKPTGEERGNWVGYAQTALRLMEHLPAAGVELDDDAPVAVHYTSGGEFRPIPGKRNVLFTMVEKPEHALDLKPHLDQADVLVTCSDWCRDLLAQASGRRVHLCPLGVDTHTFSRVSRKWDPRKDVFRWLYVGSPSYRKHTLTLDIWSMLLSRLPGFRQELYWKTTGVPTEAILAMEAAGMIAEVEPGVWSGESITLDCRFLDLPDLARLYHEAHAGLLLHSGEGWGATGLEMLATGLPLVLTAYSGVMQYASSANSYLVDAEMQRIACDPCPENPAEYVDVMAPNGVSAMRQTVAILQDYRRALRVGGQGASDARRFTWGASARALSRILHETAV